MNAPAYQPPKLSKGQTQAVQLNLFGFLVRLRTRDLLRPREAAEILQCSPDTVLDLIQRGTFETLELSAKGEARPQYRIFVRSFLLYVASISRLDAEDWDDLLVTFCDKLDVRSIDRLVPLLTTRRARLVRG